ncbi:MAG: hypothetical protein ACT4PT_04830 [Methanobacteriota archaeon]
MTAGLRAAATMLVLVLSGLTVSGDADAATTQVLAITSATASPTVAYQAFDGSPPKVFDIDRDGDIEIIVQNDNQWVYVFDSRNGRLLFEVKTPFPAGWSARSLNGPEIAILAEDNTVRLVLANSAAVIAVYRFDPGSSSGTRLSFVKEWHRRLDDCFGKNRPDGPAMDGKPVLADLDRNGRLDIVGSTEENGVFALRTDGTDLWPPVCIGGGNAEPGVGDVRGDSYPDVIHASDAGVVTAINGRTGAQLWRFDVKQRFNLGVASMPVGPSVTQLDGVGGPDVVIGVRDAHDSTNLAANHATLLALNSAGQLLWARQDPQGNPLTYTHAIVVDAAGDGASEVYWGDWNTYGHKPPPPASPDAWKRTGPANYYRYDRAGNLVWKTVLDTWWSNKDLAVADADGDGVQEVLVNCPSNDGGEDGIWYLDSRTGTKETFVSVRPWKVQRGPIVADLYGTGGMQWIVPADPHTTSAGPAILVYDTGVGYDAAWPHLPYASRGAPAPPPPPPSGTFDANFRIKSPNAWWQEVYVEPATPRTIAGVEVRINGQLPWRPMTKASWCCNAWTSSYNTPAGTRVEFRATDTGNSVSQSAPFTWLDGTLVKGSVPPDDGTPPPPILTASFSIPPGVNEWWVAVEVQASAPVVSVEVFFNGAWRPLEKMDWDTVTWARSYNVVQGTTVQFRATGSNGAQATSGTYQWLVSGSDFSATFTVPWTNVNNYWVQVVVSASRPLTKVEVLIGGSSTEWKPLDRMTWDSSGRTWAKSYPVPKGTAVRFRATADTGATADSGTFTWP